MQDLHVMPTCELWNLQLRNLDVPLFYLLSLLLPFYKRNVVKDVRLATSWYKGNFRLTLLGSITWHRGNSLKG